MVQADDYRLPLPENITKFQDAKRLVLDLFKDWIIPVCLMMLRMYPEHVAEQLRLAEQFEQNLKACSNNFKDAKRLVKE